MSTYQRNLSAFLLCLMVFSCNKSGSNHLPPDKMGQVLLDITMAETFSSTGRELNHFGFAKNMDTLAVFYKDIFDHYHITKEEFTQSMNWYKEHPDDLDTIYGKLATRADKMLTLENSKHKQ